MAIVHHVAVWRDDGAGRMWCVEGEPVDGVDGGIVDNHNASANCRKVRAVGVVFSLVCFNWNRVLEGFIVPE